MLRATEGVGGVVVGEGVVVDGEGGEDGSGGGDGRQSSTFAASLIDFVNKRQDKKYNKKGLGVPITVEMFADWIGVIDVEETFSQYVE